MGERYVVELRLTDVEIAPGAGPGSPETWSATVGLTGHSPTAMVSARGAAEGLRALTAAFRAQPDGSRALGRALTGLLLPGPVEQALWDHCLSLLRPQDTLHVRILCADPVAAALPWELTHAPFPSATDDGEGSHVRLHLVNSSHPCVVSRVTSHGAQSGPRGTLRTVVVSAAEVHGEVHDADGRRVGVVEQISADSAADALWAAETAVRRLRKLGPAGPPLLGADLDGLKAALSTTTEIVCVIAHGWAESPERSGILLHGPTGKPELLPAEDLAGLLYGAGTQLVVLVCCNTAGGMESFEGWGSTAEQLAAKVPAVVAMQSVVEPDIGHDFLVGLVRGLHEHGEIHAAMAEGHRRVAKYAVPGHLGVPALYTGPNGLRLRDAPLPSRPGLPYGYPVDALDGPAADGRRVRLDVVWGLDRRPFVGVLLDAPHHDPTDDLNGWEAQSDGVLSEGGLRPRRWFRVEMNRPPRPGSTSCWQEEAVRPRSLWTEFRRDFPGEGADHGWVLGLALPDAGGAWAPGEWRAALDEWLPRLCASDGRPAVPVIVVLHGAGPSLRAWGVTALRDVRDQLAARLGIPVTALSRHRPGRVHESGYPQQGTAGAREPESGAVNPAEPVDEPYLRALRATAPARYQRTLARLAADPGANGRRASLAIAADYDDDMRTWIRAAHEAGAPLPRRRDLTLTVTTERADTVVLALVERLSTNPGTDLSTWDDLLFSGPVGLLFRQYRDVWRNQPPSADQLAGWLALHPSAAPAAARAGLTTQAAAVLAHMAVTTAPWPVLRAFGADGEALRHLLRLPDEPRDALGLVDTDPKSKAEAEPVRGHGTTLRIEHIRAALGRTPPAVSRPLNVDKATR
ncbi:CHAT domain-containing protein [Streptomyces phaeofaciens]|uniref:CHAT domain-containing protein n=1 Tax=Streptomyces phaeofaciens TaxID=68254 RepID=UPI0036BA59B1